MQTEFSTVILAHGQNIAAQIPKLIVRRTELVLPAAQTWCWQHSTCTHLLPLPRPSRARRLRHLSTRSWRLACWPTRQGHTADHLPCLRRDLAHRLEVATGSLCRTCGEGDGEGPSYWTSEVGWRESRDILLMLRLLRLRTTGASDIGFYHRSVPSDIHWSGDVGGYSNGVLGPWSAAGHVQFWRLRPGARTGLLSNRAATTNGVQSDMDCQGTGLGFRC